MFDVLGTQPSDFKPQEPAIGRSGRVESEFEVKNSQFLQPGSKNDNNKKCVCACAGFLVIARTA